MDHFKENAYKREREMAWIRMSLYSEYGDVSRYIYIGQVRKNHTREALTEDAKGFLKIAIR